MPINNSGPISMGGTVVGESIALELGLSATAQISLNDTAVRNLAGILSGMISMGAFYGKSSYPKLIFHGLTAPFQMSHAFVHNDRVVILGETFTINTAVTTNIGTSEVTNSRVTHILVYDLNGNLIWRRAIDATRNDTSGAHGVVLGNELLVARGTGTSAANDVRAVVVRFNFDNGTHNSTQVYGRSSGVGGSETMYDTNIFSGSTNVYSLGIRISVPFTYSIPGLSMPSSTPTLVIFNSGGSILVQRRMGVNGSGTGAPSIGSIHPNSTHAHFVTSMTGVHPIVDGANFPTSIGALCKYSSAGVIQWRRRYNNFNISPGGQNSGGQGAAVIASNDDIFHCFTHRYLINVFTYVVRVNTNGSIIWSRKVSDNQEVYGMILDEPNNRVYIFTRRGIIEYSMDGVFQKFFTITYTDGLVTTAQSFPSFVSGQFGLRIPTQGFSLGVGALKFAAVQHGSRQYNAMPGMLTVPGSIYNSNSGTWTFVDGGTTWTYTAGTFAVTEQATEAMSLVDDGSVIDEAINLNTTSAYNENIITSSYNIFRSTTP